MRNGREPLRVGIATLGLAGAACALAEPNPYSLGVAQAFGHESNLFRVPSGQVQTSDSLSTTSLLAGIDQPFGRQRLRADLALNHTRYRDNDQLNHNGYELGAGLDWEAAGRLSGTLALTRKRALARFGVGDGPLITTRNEETGTEWLARVRYGLASLLVLEAELTHRMLDYSDAAYRHLELRQDAVGVGLRYSPSGLLTLGTALRHTRGRYPSAVEPSPGSFLPDHFSRNDLDLTAAWVPTGLSTLRARVSLTRESHEALASRDVSGLTGALSWDYQPTAKLRFTTELSRDTGAASAFVSQAAGSPASFGSGSQISNALGVRAVYEATAKIRLEADGRQVTRQLVSAFALPSGEQSRREGSDRFREIRLAAIYEPSRHWLARCGVGRERRNASSEVSYPFSANTVSCSLQFKLR